MFKRGQGRYNSDYNTQDYYDWYCATVSDPVPKWMFKEIFKKFIERIMIEIIYNSFEFNMGHKLGLLRIRDKKYEIVLDENGEIDKRRLSADWGRTLKKWKQLYKDIDPSEWHSIKNKPIIYHENDHSDQMLKQWFWDKAAYNLANQGSYRFNATRTWDRLLAKVNKESNITYYR